MGARTLHGRPPLRKGHARRPELRGEDVPLAAEGVELLDTHREPLQVPGERTALGLGVFRDRLGEHSAYAPASASTAASSPASARARADARAWPRGIPAPARRAETAAP